MRELRQLGTAYLVFPSASHRRFEHSIGTGHLANKYAKSLLVDNPIEDQDNLISCVTLAGLCHNIGHGPYSYPFTDFVKQHLKYEDFDISQYSAAIIDHIVDNKNIDKDKYYIDLIKDLVIGRNQYTEKDDSKGKVIY
jgi:HD superfamily phosphohydrolase